MRSGLRGRLWSLVGCGGLGGFPKIMLNEGYLFPKTGVLKIGLYLRMEIFDPREEHEEDCAAGSKF